MGRQIIKQPSGRFAVWSSVVDDFTILEATKEQIIQLWADEEREVIKKRVNDVCEMLDKGQKPYYQFTQTWEEALAFRKEVHPGAKNIRVRR